MGLTRRPTLFVFIASYRDPECAQTVRDLFEQALYPDRIAVGICWQVMSPDDDQLFEQFCATIPRKDQVRWVVYDARDSKGACWAKSEAQKLWQGEDYLLAIDSHMRFVSGWDVLMIQLLHDCPAAKPILSTYPARYEPPAKFFFDTFQIVPDKFDPHTKILLLRGIGPCQTDAPRRGAFIAGGFCFCAASFMMEVPYDPLLYFNGEEVSMSVRAWSCGWDVFAPHRCLLYHHYGRPHAAKHWEDHGNWRERRGRAAARVNHLLGVSPNLDPAVTAGLNGPYGLGPQRTVEQFEQFSGVFFKDQIITERARLGEFC